MNQISRGKANVGKLIIKELNVATLTQTGTANGLTLTPEELTSNIVFLTGTPNGGFNVIFNILYKNFYTIVNKSGQTATLKNAAGATTTVADGAVALVQNTGVDMIALTGQSGTQVTLTGVQNLTNKTLTSPKIDDGDADVTITSADQTSAVAVITIPDCGDAADEFVLKDTQQTLTLKTLTAPVLNTPTLSAPLLADGGTGVTIASANQTNAAPTVTIPDILDAADEFVMKDTAATLTLKTIDGATNTVKNIAHAYAGNITRAEMIAGKILVAARAGMNIKVLSVKILVTGAFDGGAGTAFVLKDTSSTVTILTAAKAALTNLAKISTEGLAIANVTEGAGMTAALTAANGILVEADAAWNAGTGIDIVILYMYV